MCSYIEPDSVAGFDWDETNTEHIARHQVEPAEVEEAFADRSLLMRSWEGRYVLLGRSAGVEMKIKKLPHFKTDEEFGRFVDAHDMAHYFDSMEKIDNAFTLAPALAERIRQRAKKRLIALRLPEWQISGARRVAKRKKVPYQALMRHWIGEGLSRELRRPGRPA